MVKLNNRIVQTSEKLTVMRFAFGKSFKVKQAIRAHTVPEMFTVTNYRRIYEACIELMDKDFKVDEYSLWQEFDKNDSIRPLIIGLWNEMRGYSEYNYQYDVNMIKTAYFDRLYEKAKNWQDYKKIKELDDSLSLKTNVVPISHDINQFISDYTIKDEKPIDTGYKTLNNQIALQKGDLMILAGAPGMGKTCMLINLMLNIAKTGKKILFFSLEMSLSQIQNRIIAAEKHIKASSYRNHTLTNDEREVIFNYANSDDFQNLPIEICTDYDITVDKISVEVSRNNADIVCIDYLGLIKNKEGYSVYEKVSEISRSLKQLALMSNKSFIVLHQLSRIKEERKNKEPNLGDLRDSGKIEQDADVVAFVYRENYYNKAVNNDNIQFLIKKNRHGSTNKGVTLHYESDIQKITEWSV